MTADDFKLLASKKLALARLQKEIEELEKKSADEAGWYLEIDTDAGCCHGGRGRVFLPPNLFNLFTVHEKKYGKYYEDRYCNFVNVKLFTPLEEFSIFCRNTFNEKQRISAKDGKISVEIVDAIPDEYEIV